AHGIRKSRLCSGARGLPLGSQLECCAQFILIEGHVPGRGEIAVRIGDDVPRLVSGASVVVAGVWDMKDLAGDGFAGGGTAAGNQDRRAGRVVGRVGGDPGGTLGEAGASENRNEKEESSPECFRGPKQPRMLSGFRAVRRKKTAR